MRDPLSWSFPLGRLFGITVRVHILFPVFAAAFILRAVYLQNKESYPPNLYVDVVLLMLILFGSVLLHEFGHCVGARLVDGDAHDILLWPLGGLAYVEVPHKPRAHLIATAAGPITNLLICLVSAVALWWASGLEVRPPFNPFWYPYRMWFGGAGNQLAFAELWKWNGEPYIAESMNAVVFLARVFWVNWVLFLLNMVLVGFPMDAGRLFQCALWPWYGFRQATLAAIMMGFVTMIVITVCAIVANEVWPFLLAMFIYATCRQQWIILETGGEEGLFGYDFSQGYTSLEGDAPPPRRKRPNLLKRWLQKRAASMMTNIGRFRNVSM